MGSMIIANNIQVAFVVFAVGITLLGSIYALVFNGVIIGAVFGLYQNKGIIKLLLAFVAPHSVLELSAITIAGGAGFLIAAAVVLPGNRTRREALIENGKRAMSLVTCAILFLLVAGSLEGLVSSVRSVERRAAGGAGPAASSYCHACFSGDYAIPFAPSSPGKQLRLVSG